MKKFLLLVVVFLSLVSVGRCDVVGQIIGKAIDDNGNIIIQTAYFLDGQNVPSRYPQQAGVFYWVTRYSFQNFDGMDAKGIEARIQQDVDAFAQSLITKKYTAEQNSALDLGSLIGKTFTTTTAEIQLSPTKALTVKTDGTSIQKVLTPVEAIIK